jgi:HemY protein
VVTPLPAAAQDNSPAQPIAVEPAPLELSAPPPPPLPAEPVTVTAAPLFRARTDIPGMMDRNAAGMAAVIPIVRAPDDPGVDDESGRDEFADQISPPQAQAGGWRGFLSRWGS